jgi:hypothetical protein
MGRMFRSATVRLCPAASDLFDRRCQKGKESNDESERILSLENAWNQAEVNHDTKALTMLPGGDV